MPDFFESHLHACPFVSAQPGTLALHFKIGELQSLMSIDQPSRLVVPYTKTMMGFLLIKPEPTHILMIGLGGGSLAKFCYQNLPNTRITVVEISPHVIALRSRFQVPEDDARFAVVCADGADFVRDTSQVFDVILVDGFDVQGQSTQLSTRVFYENCCRVLMRAGVMVTNLDGDHPAHTVFLQRLHQTFKSNAVEISVEERGNHIVFTAKDVAISPRSMSLSWSLGHHSAQTQNELKTEFQRILQTLDSLDPHTLGDGSLHPGSPNPTSFNLSRHHRFADQMTLNVGQEKADSQFESECNSPPLWTTESLAN